MGDALRKATGVTEVIVLPGLHAEYAAEPADRLWVTLADREAEDTYTPTAEVADRDPLTYLYTSGTTSFPKGVVASHLAIYLESMSAALDSGWSAADSFAAMMPMFHTAQLNAFCTPAVLVGATIHVMRGFDPVALLDLVERERITQVFGLPMMYRATLEHPSFAERDLSSLKRAVYAMAPMPDALIRACLEGFGCDFALLFGQTEMSPCTTLFRPEHQLTHIGAVGTPLVGVQVAIMGPDGELLPPGEQGEIVYRGPSTMTEYLDNPEATAEAFAHGWFHSGDVGHFGDDGVLWFADRYKDVIKTGGENVASIEVEKAIYAADAAVGEVVGGRAAARAVERGDHRGGRAQARRDRRGARAARRAARPPGPVQDPEGGDRGGRDAAHVHRKIQKNRLREDAPGPLWELSRAHAVCARPSHDGAHLGRRPDRRRSSAPTGPTSSR